MSKVLKNALDNDNNNNNNSELVLVPKRELGDTWRRMVSTIPMPSCCPTNSVRV